MPKPKKRGHEENVFEYMNFIQERRQASRKLNYRDHVERESTEVPITQKLEKKEETLTKKMKRSLDERHS